jgi:D-alanyl-D-alanine carboxypeptidase/D-alanyl-D-alanine-endopeptidase (penicillin-binding protein 4)
VAKGTRRRRGVKVPLLVVLVLVLLGGAGAGAWRLGLADRWLGDPDDRTGDPAAVAAPEGLELPPVEEPDPLLAAVDATAGALDPAALQAALTPQLADEDLGPRVGVAVAPLSGADPWTAGVPQVVPASTTKVLTSVAALETLGPDHTFTTEVVDAGPAEPTDGATDADTDGAADAAGAVHRIVLVGGGDPLLTREPVPTERPSRYGFGPSLRQLATATAAALTEAGRTQVQLSYDASLFTGPGINPVWPASYVPDDVVAPIAALTSDRGYDDEGDPLADPAAATAAWFAGALAEAGITVVGEPSTGLAGNSPRLAAVDSAPLGEIVEHLLAVSDNETTEVLAHHVGLEVEGAGSFEGGAAGVRRVLADLGVDLGADVLTDGSGLSRENLLAPTTLVEVLAVASSPDRPELRHVLSGLPVAGFSGSLANRFTTADPAGLGSVRAKTGTLTGVQGLAGIVQDATGQPLLFVVVADGVDPAAALDAREAIDRTAAALAACACTTGAAPEEPTDGPTDGTTDGPTDGATDGATDGTTASDGAAAATGRDVLSPA